MAAKIGLAYEEFDNPDLPPGMKGRHLFIVYTDEAGVSHVLEGGRKDGVGENIATKSGILSHDPAPSDAVNGTDGTYIYKAAVTASTYVEVATSDPADVWREMLDHAQALDALSLKYIFNPGPNSNSVVATIMHNAGLDVQKALGIKIPADLAPENIYEKVSSGQMAMTSVGFIGAQKALSRTDAAVLHGTTDGEQLTGSSGSDAIYGRGGNDTLTGGTGNDHLDGGAGMDSAVFSGPRANYSVTATASGFTVRDNVGSDGVDTLVAIERAHFADGVVALDIAGGAIAGQAYRLYQAAFDRTPDVAGLSHNVRMMDDGLGLKQMSAAFIVSAEFTDRYGAAPSDTAFLTALYNNVLGRDPDEGGLQGWLNLLAPGGGYDRADVLIGFSESQENITLVGSAIENGIWLG